MDILRLVCSLLLPWLLGFLVVQTCQNYLTDQHRTNPYRSLGFGFFIGYLILYLLIRLNLAVTGTLQYPLVIGSICVMLVPVIYAYKVTKRTANSVSTTNLPGYTYSRQSKWQSLAYGALLTLIILHWSFSLLETLLRPLYPWDAFTTWSYAAKAWYYGGYSEFISPGEWATHPNADQFTSHAHHYPIFSSLIQLWAATGLGRWSETLINLPQLLAGTAIGLALYGEGKSQGFTPTQALLLCYLFSSIPLLNTHLSLGGYADIWLAGYTGLGFVALISSIIKDDRFTLILGLLLTATGILVKFEGSVWLLMAIAFLLLHRLGPKKSLLILLMIGSLVGIAYLFDQTLIKLPGIGLVGIEGANLFLPGIGLIKMQYHDVWHAYLQNFFLFSSWSLLWSALLISLALCLLFQGTVGYHKERNAALLFILLFVASQFIIFFLTDQGRWAEKFTSINRLPLQFTPALVFALSIIWKGMKNFSRSEETAL